MKCDKLENLNQDIIFLEKDISELVNIFEDLQIMVNSQSNILDSIEDNIISSTENTDQPTRKNSYLKQVGVWKILGCFV